MKAVNILLFAESRYPVNRRKIRKAVEGILAEQEIGGPVEVSVALVGNRKMRALNKKFREKDETTDVLAFSIMEGKPTLLPPDGILRLGDVVISYPEAVANAARKEILVDEEINFLLRHGVFHLLGIHEEK